jgi:hypothetical protein
MAETQIEIGDLIENRYRVLSVISKGEMGVLYRVSDEADDDVLNEQPTMALIERGVVPDCD